MKQTFKTSCAAQGLKDYKSCTDLGREQKDLLVILDTLRVCIKASALSRAMVTSPCAGCFASHVPWPHAGTCVCVALRESRRKLLYSLKLHFTKKKGVSFSLDQLAKGK